MSFRASAPRARIGLAQPFAGRQFGGGLWSHDLSPPFCLICPARMILPMFTGDFTQLTIDFSSKTALAMTALGMMVTALFVVGSFVKKRFFCFLCPMSALHYLFSKLALFRLKKDGDKCTRCGDCYRVCDLEIKEIADEVKKRDIMTDDCTLCAGVARPEEGAQKATSLRHCFESTKPASSSAQRTTAWTPLRIPPFPAHTPGARSRDHARSHHRRFRRQPGGDAVFLRTVPPRLYPGRSVAARGQADRHHLHPGARRTHLRGRRDARAPVQRLLPLRSDRRRLHAREILFAGEGHEHAAFETPIEASQTDLIVNPPPAIRRRRLGDDRRYGHAVDLELPNVMRARKRHYWQRSVRQLRNKPREGCSHAKTSRR
jgi:ferredoxin